GVSGVLPTRPHAQDWLTIRALGCAGVSFTPPVRMRRTRVALIVSLVWLAAVAAAGLGMWLLPPLIGAPLVLCATGLAFAAAYLIARRIDHEMQDKLARLATAVGAQTSEASIEAIIASLAGRLERASQFKSAFSAL